MESTDVFTAIFDLFARAYLGGPRAVSIDRLPAFDALLAASGLVDPKWPGLLRSLLPRESDDLASLKMTENDFLERLVVPVQGCYVPPYASVYLDGGGGLWGRSTFEVLSWYEAEGLSWSQYLSGRGEMRILAPDHIGVELAFLSILAGRSTIRHSRQRSENSRDKMLAHLADWLPLFEKAQREATPAASACTKLADWTAFAVEVVQLCVTSYTDSVSLR